MREANNCGLSILNNQIYLNGHPVYLLTAEFPYYRLDPSQWEDRINKIKAAGIKVITCYIPWNFHEYNDNEFDFKGKSEIKRRNVKGFFELIKKKEMYIIAKPGPFICAEVQHGGIPDWLTNLHPEIVTKNHQGREVGFRQDGGLLPAYLDKTYVFYVSRWYRKVCREVLLPYQNPAGPLIALQVENEIPYSTSELADPFSCGYSKGEISEYQRWLKHRYADLSKYNSLHKTSYDHWQAIFPPIEWQLTGKEDWLKYQDWVMFKDWYGAQTLKVYGRILVETGIKVPLYHNILMLEDEAYVNYYEMAQQMWIGVNFWPNSHPMYNFDSYVAGQRRLKQLKGAQPDKAGYAPELNTAWGNEQEFDFLIRYTLPYLCGTNIYPIVNGDKAGTLNDRPYSNNPEPYPGNAPIKADGSFSPAYHSIKNLALFLNGEGADIAAANLVAEIAIGYYPPYNYQRNYTLWGKQPKEPLKKVFKDYTDMNWFMQQLMKIFVRTNVAYSAIDIQHLPLPELKKYKIILSAGYDYMDAKTQQKLVNYVKDGGILIMFPRTPYLNLKMQECDILRKTLYSARVREGKKKDPFLPIKLSWIGFEDEVFGSSCIDEYELPKEYKILATNSQGKPCAYEHSYGKGKALLIGTNVFVLSENDKFFLWLFKKYGANSRYAYSEDADVEVIYKKNKETIYLFAINRGVTNSEKPIYFVSQDSKWHKVDTTILAKRVSIIAIRENKVMAGALVGSPGTKATIQDKGIKTDKSQFVYLARYSPTEYRFYMNRTGRVEVLKPSNWLCKSKIHLYLGQSSSEAECQITEDTIKFHFNVGEGEKYNYYRLLYEEVR